MEVNAFTTNVMELQCPTVEHVKHFRPLATAANEMIGFYQTAASIMAQGTSKKDLSST